MHEARTDTKQRYAQGLLRIVAGFLFWQHGAQKLLGWFGGVGQDGGTVELVSIMGLAGIIEFFGGLLLIFGLFTVPAAFIMAGEMAVAYFYAHFPRGWSPIENGGEKAALYAFVFLFFAAAGPGAWSLDGVLRRRRETKKGMTV